MNPICPFSPVRVRGPKLPPSRKKNICRATLTPTLTCAGIKLYFTGTHSCVGRATSGAVQCRIPNRNKNKTGLNLPMKELPFMLLLFC